MPLYSQPNPAAGEGNFLLLPATFEHTLMNNIAIHRKFQTRRVAEDSTRLYGEAAQHRMRLSVDGYKQRLKESLTEINPMLVLLAGAQNPATLPEYGARRTNRRSPQTGTTPFDNEVTHANTRNRDMVH